MIVSTTIIPIATVILIVVLFAPNLQQPKVDAVTNVDVDLPFSLFTWVITQSKYLSHQHEVHQHF
jgi:hypothetical protein